MAALGAHAFALDGDCVAFCPGRSVHAAAGLTASRRLEGREPARAPAGGERDDGPGGSETVFSLTYHDGAPGLAAGSP